MCSYRLWRLMEWFVNATRRQSCHWLRLTISIEQWDSASHSIYTQAVELIYEKQAESRLLTVTTEKQWFLSHYQMSRNLTLNSIIPRSRQISFVRFSRNVGASLNHSSISSSSHPSYLQMRPRSPTLEPSKLSLTA